MRILQATKRLALPIALIAFGILHPISTFAAEESINIKAEQTMKFNNFAYISWVPD